MLAFTAPLLYCLLLGSAWGVFFKKKFADSLAPAFMLHIIIVMLAGMTLHKLSVGIWGGMLLFAGALAYKLKKAPQEARAFLRSSLPGGVFIFIIFYIFCFYINEGKRFIFWDEFSHWGMFLKESLRLDALYTESLLPFRHKDYVPAATLFEVIWCHLSGGFREPYAYRALHMLGFSMLLPLISSIAPGEGEEGGKNWRWVLHQSGAAFLLILALQLLFQGEKTNTFNNFNFYNSIYVDALLGMALFYCFMLAYRDATGEEKYQALVLALGFSTLALLKQTGIALLLMVFAYYAAHKVCFRSGRLGRAWVAQLVAPLLVALLLWYSFFLFTQGFADRLFIHAETTKQSYSSVFSHIFFEAPSETRTHLGELGRVFMHALLGRSIAPEVDINLDFFYFLNAPYAAIVVCAAGGVFAIACAADTSVRKKIAFAGISLFLAAIAYAALVYLLYIVAFPPYRALVLGSYFRYMGTMAMALLLAAAFIYYDSKVWARHVALYYILLAVAAAYLIFSPIPVSPFLSVPVRNENVRAFGAKREEAAASILSTALPPSGGICMLHLAKEAFVAPRLKFYLHPLELEETVGNSWALNMPASSQLQECMLRHGWLYINRLGVDFLDNYVELFANPGMLKSHTLYKVYAAEGGSIRLEERAFAGDSERVRDSWPALMWAASRGHAEMVRQLLGSGAKVDAADAKGWTALQLAAAKGHAVTAGTLLDAGADIDRANALTGWTALLEAARHGHVQVAKVLIERGADVNAANSRSDTALACAAMQGHSEVVRLLLASGAEVDAADAKGWTALQMAAQRGYAVTAGTLLDAGADVNRPNPQTGWTPLLEAASRGHMHVVSVLIERGVDVNMANSRSGDTALARAAMQGHSEVVRLLLDSGAEVDAPNRRGWTPLMHAARHGHEDVVRLLLEHGANAKAKARGKKGATALQLAEQRGHKGIVQMLREAEEDGAAPQQNLGRATSKTLF